MIVIGVVVARVILARMFVMSRLLSRQRDVGLVTAMHRRLAQIPLPADGKTGDEFPCLITLAFRAFAPIGVPVRGELLESEAAGVAVKFVKGHI